jgi:two-component system invasion response regulator UvrY
MPRILIGDDHAVFRRGIREILCEHWPSVEVAEAGSGSEMVELARNTQWDVFIMDITMPGQSGTDLLQELRQIRPETPVLPFSMHPENTYALRMIRSGASGYLNKATTPDELMTALKTVMAGRRYISPQFAECLVETYQCGTSKILHKGLSNREFQIMRKLASGKGLKTIAAELAVSPNTISTYRSRLLRKLGLNSNAELARYCIEHGLN